MYKIKFFLERYQIYGTRIEGNRTRAIEVLSAYL